MRLAGKKPTPESYRTFIGFAWEQMVATGASGWSAPPACNDFGKHSLLLHEGSSPKKLQLLYGAVFGLRLDADWLPVQSHMNCDFGPVTDDVERSLRPSSYILHRLLIS